jgi:putative hydroxymethylpyrimidine transport system ATP-binding protein
MGTDMPPGNAPRVHLHAADLRYGDTTIFEALDLTLPAGRTTCLLGPSGVGKTSLLRLIAGLAHGAQGQAEDEAGNTLDGRIAYLAQQDLLLPWSSVLNNVLLGPRLRNQPVTGALEQRARDLIAQVGLAGREADRPGRLSGGMRQRVALARTLMESRPVVLMDEPFSALDAITRYQLQGLAAGLLRGRTVLLVTHDPLEALRLGHDVRVMSGAPARLDEPLEAPGEPPRDLGDSQVLRLQAELLRRLGEAQAGQGRGVAGS